MSTTNTEPGENNIQQLTDIMFDQMKRLSDPGVDLDKEIKRAQAISAAGTVVINAAKVRVDAVRVAEMQKKNNGGIKPGPKEIGNGE